MLAREVNGTVFYTHTVVTSIPPYKCACHSFKKNSIQVVKKSKINIECLTLFSKAAWRLVLIYTYLLFILLYKLSAAI